MQIAVNLNGNLSLKSVYQEAWKLVKGSKAPLWLPMIVGMFLLGVVEKIAMQIFQFTPDQAFPYWYTAIFAPLLFTIIMAPFAGGINAVAIQRARGQTVHIFAGFHCFDRLLELVGSLVFTLFVTNIVTIIVSLYSDWAADIARFLSLLLGVFFVFSMPLLVDKKITLLGALEASFKIATHFYWRLIIIYLLLGLIAIAVFFTTTYLLAHHPSLWMLGIPLAIFMFWFIPFMNLVLGVIYVRIVV